MPQRRKTRPSSQRRNQQRVNFKWVPIGLAMLLGAQPMHVAAVDLQSQSQSQSKSQLQLRGSMSASSRASYSTGHGYCELCMHTIHQVQYGSLPSCAQSAKSYGSCSQVVQVILGQAASVLQLIEEGCYQYDSYKDWQTIKPCPSHAICGRLHNNFDVDLRTLCPKDFHCLLYTSPSPRDRG